LPPRASVPPAAELAPLSAAEFNQALAPLGPFEPRPRLAVAVSGGADSMALVLQADRWARARGGEAIALIVDHRLRPESAREARDVARRLAARQIPARILVWSGRKPQGDIQAAARAARYALLSAWCQRAGVLHLLAAHHRDDQAETLLLNLARGSGVDGLAAMAAMSVVDGIRLLRPLLDVPKSRLVATLRAHGETWVEDPSNISARYRRTAARTLTASALAPLAPGAVDAARLGERLAATAARMARARSALEQATATLLAESVELLPHGFARIDIAAFRAAPEEIGLRALARVVMCIGGGVHPPRHAQLGHALAMLNRASTLAGCRLTPTRGISLIWRELRAVATDLELTRGRWTPWDGRFLVRVQASGYRVGALGTRPVTGAATTVPRRLWPSLTAISDARGLTAVPALGFRRADAPPLELIFRPARGLTPLAIANNSTM
jgi:tRNA(Ile)-lysidine synthase